MGILVRWFFLTGAILLASYIIDGIEVAGFFSAFFAAAILGILNALLRPILIILTLPINIITKGLFFGTWKPGLFNTEQCCRQNHVYYPS